MTDPVLEPITLDQARAAAMTGVELWCVPTYRGAFYAKRRLGSQSQLALALRGIEQPPHVNLQKWEFFVEVEP